jgi:hypothetical protein
MLGTASPSLASSSDPHRWTDRRCHCRCGALVSIFSATIPDVEDEWSNAVTSTTTDPVQCAVTVVWEPTAIIPPGNPVFAEGPNQGSQGLGRCFKCGMSGHFAQHCPNQQHVLGSGSKSWPQGKQSYTYGKVNHVATEEAQQAQDIVLGMFLASSHSATVLFDSGASHSFISSTFVAKYHLPMSIMKHTMLVSSPGGEMRTKHICLAISP